MIEFRAGNLLEADAEALVNPVNCVGVMGRGLALQFKHAWPANFVAYRQACEAGRVRPGQVFVFSTNQPRIGRFILNFPTKRHWRDRSRIEDIESGLVSLVHEVESRQIRSIALPALGAGLGGLPWPVVRAAIETALANLDGVAVQVFQPGQDRMDRRSAPLADHA